MDDELARLVELARQLGATEEEIVEAGPFLGPLCLDLATRPEGGVESFTDVADVSQIPIPTAARLWRALGFPDPALTATRLTTHEATVLRMMAFIGTEVLGEDRVMDIARVIGASTARAAEALVDGFRIGYEVPQLQQEGRPYSDVAVEYAEFTGAFLPDFLVGIGALVRRHIVGAAYQTWWTDEAGSTVTVDRVVGFVDLVGYTAAAMRLSTSELTGIVDRFERRVAELVGTHGGRLVKTIGDEAMFVFGDDAPACNVAEAVLSEFGDEVRVGMAHGLVASIRGDYYGPIVNLASRLCASAEPGSAVVDAVIAATDGAKFAPLGPLTLKGFHDSVVAFRLL